MDFLMVADESHDQIAAKSHYMSAGRRNLPMVCVRCSHEWGQGAQHSQGVFVFHAVPGLKVVGTNYAHTPPSF